MMDDLNFAVDRAVVGLDVLIDDPDVLSPKLGTPKLANEIFIPLGYINRIMAFDKEDSNRGDACTVLENRIPVLLENSTQQGDRFVTELENGTKIIFAEVKAEPNPRSSKDQAITLAKELGGNITIIASHCKLRLLAARHRIPCKHFTPKVYTGRREVVLPADCASLWYNRNGLSIKNWLTYIDPIPPSPNEYIEFKPEFSNEDDRFHIENLGRCKFDSYTETARVIPLEFTKLPHKAYNGIFPRTAVQAMMFDALLAPPSDIPIVMIPGVAGSGKTFASVAAGLSQIEAGSYDRFYVVKSETRLGKDIGFLPGNIVNKTMPLGASVVSALRAVLNLRDNDKVSYKVKNGANNNDDIDYSNNPLGLTPMMQFYIDKYFQFMPLIFVKGDSVPNSILYYDEAQDFTRPQIREIITRAGEGSKIIFTGDPRQSDFGAHNANFSGLDYVARHLQEKDYVAVIRPSTSEEVIRSNVVSRIISDINDF